MKHKNISFAEVLKSKTRSPQPCSKVTSNSLAEILSQWEQYPHEDYTLNLGGFTRSFKNHPSSSRLIASKTPQHEEEEMFDSWIQRQSAVNSNKENVPTQFKRVTPGRNKQQPPAAKVGFSSRIKEVASPKAN